MRTLVGVLASMAVLAGCGKDKGSGSGGGKATATPPSPPLTTFVFPLGASVERDEAAKLMRIKFNAGYQTGNGWLLVSKLGSGVALASARRADDPQGYSHLEVPWQALVAAGGGEFQIDFIYDKGKEPNKSTTFEYYPPPPPTAPQLALVFDGARDITGALEPCADSLGCQVPVDVISGSSLGITIKGPAGAQVTLDGQSVTLTDAPTTITLQPLERLGKLGPQDKLQLVVTGTGPGGAVFDGTITLRATSVFMAMVEGSGGTPMVFPDEPHHDRPVTVRVDKDLEVTAMHDIDRAIFYTRRELELPSCGYRTEAGQQYWIVRAKTETTFVLIDRHTGKTLAKKVVTGKPEKCSKDVLVSEKDTAETQVFHPSTEDTDKAIAALLAHR